MQTPDTKEHQNDHEERRVFNESGHDAFLREGKAAINNMLFTWLPGTTTLDELEDIACEYHDAIVRAWSDSRAAAAHSGGAGLKGKDHDQDRG